MHNSDGLTDHLTLAMAGVIKSRVVKGESYSMREIERAALEASQQLVPKLIDEIRTHGKHKVIEIIVTGCERGLKSTEDGGSVDG